MVKKNVCFSHTCVNYSSCYECPSSCSLGMHCGNQRIQNREWKNLLVFKDNQKGLGLKALSLILKGDLIVEYTGLAVSDKSLIDVDPDRQHYLMLWYGAVLLNADVFGSVARYINHSCDPNSMIQVWVSNGIKRNCVIALRNINEFEEITYDYNWTTAFAERREKCNCLSKICRGYIQCYHEPRKAKQSFD